MELDENTSFAGQNSMYCGAIFMSNRTTMKECLSRKLFGLPYSQASFVKRVKAGMLLFLFEHERRRLYGLFEATSDGALNIVPNAFASSGKLFPAQIHFKRIWMCKPLSEAEFCDAIKENYYTHNKFHFFLSYKQVLKLTHLFSSKKTSPDGSEPRLANFTHAPVPRVANFTRSTSLDGRAFRGNLPTTDCDFFQCFPGYGGEQSSTSLDMDDPSWTPKNTACNRSTMDSQIPHFRSQLHSSHPDAENLNLPYTNYQSVDLSGINGNYEGLSIPFYGSSTRSLPVLGSNSYINLQECKYLSFPENYDSSTPMTSFSEPGMPITNGTDSSSMYSPSKSQLHAHGYPDASQQNDGSRGQRYWRLEPPLLDYISLVEDEKLVKNIGSSQFLCSPQKDPSEKQYSYFSESQEARDYELSRPYHAAHSEEYNPTAPHYTLHSDTYQRRTSVFSRLSKVPPTSQQEDDESCKPDRTLSVDQVMELLSQRSKRWNTNKKVPKQSIPWDDDQQVWDDGKQLEGITELEPSGSAYLDEQELVREAMDEESSEHPFINFKRRSEVRKTGGQTETIGYVQVGMDDGSLGKYKKRKLLRPSFSEEEPSGKGNSECQNVQGSSQEIVGIRDSVVKDDGTKCAESGDASVDEGFSNCGNHSCSIQGLSQELAAGQISVLHGEGIRTINGHIGQAEERAINKEDRESVEVEIDLTEASMGNFGSRDATEQFSQESDVDCSKASASNLKAEEEKLEENTHVVSSENLMLQVHGKVEGKNSNEEGDKNPIISGRNAEGYPLKSDVNLAQVSIVNIVELKVEQTSYVVSDDNSILLARVYNGGKKPDEVSEEDMTISEGNAGNFFQNADADQAEASFQNFKGEEDEVKNASEVDNENCVASS